MRIDHCLKNLITKLGGTVPASNKITDLLSTICNINFAVLPKVTASDNDKVAKVVNGAWAAAEAGGGGGGGLLMVSLSFDETTEALSVDYTPAEIKAAVEAGKTVYCDMGGTYIPLTYTGTETCFTHISSGDNSAQFNQIIVSADKSAIMRQFDLTVDTD